VVRDEQILKLIGENIRSARLEANLTQEGLAEMAGIHWKTIGYIETGKRALGILSFARIVQCLGGGANRFFDGLPPMDAKKKEAALKALVRKRKPSLPVARL
jgi:DNA-binding XRE family transcriptional regulator